jgi:hypothetical protein
MEQCWCLVCLQLARAQAHFPLALIWEVCLMKRLWYHRRGHSLDEGAPGPEISKLLRPQAGFQEKLRTVQERAKCPEQVSIRYGTPRT